MHNFWQILTTIPSYRRRLFIIMIANVVIGCAAVSTPYIYKHLVNSITDLITHVIDKKHAVKFVVEAITAFILIRIIILAVGIWLQKVTDSFSCSVLITLRANILKKLMSTSLDYFERSQVGAIIDKTSSTIEINTWIVQFCEGSLTSVIQLFFGTAILLYKIPSVGIVMLLLISAHFGVAARGTIRTKPLLRAWKIQAGNMSGLLAEMATLILTIKSLGIEEATAQRYRCVLNSWGKSVAATKAALLDTAISFDVINIIAIGSATAIPTVGALNGRYTVGDVLLTLTLTQLLMSTFNPIAKLIGGISDVETASERLVEFFKLPNSISDNPEALPLSAIETIEFAKVSFSYPGTSRYAVDDISFRASKGQVIALVGVSGAGKSTIAKLVMRLFEPSSGNILINGKDIRSYTQSSLRSHMCLVPQDIMLFNQSVYENIRCAKPSARDEDVIAVAKQAGANGFVEFLPDKYATLVGERGVKLSGGEKQRIAIARALLRSPSLVILDEATSALDSETEQIVQHGLKQLMTGRISIVIAHRLSTVMSADKIIVMEDGKIIQEGNHWSLSQDKSSLYARLRLLQMS